MMFHWSSRHVMAIRSNPVRLRRGHHWLIYLLREVAVVEDVRAAVGAPTPGPILHPEGEVLLLVAVWILLFMRFEAAELPSQMSVKGGVLRRGAPSYAQRGPGAWSLDHGTWSLGPRAWTLVRGPWSMAPRPWPLGLRTGA